ncbi:MAG TPA: TIGR03619 family F420-dependent LLM class oxidoreductase [Candidatus Dormibacteraeota bacterium]|nr:TIGR03619 family F420-dependent LLM class oxidoreductase [Candidatus Dormibacteraeota bacterium]
MDDGIGRPAISIALSHVETLVGPHCERLLELARAVERSGAEQIALSEHVTLARVITGHPGKGPGVFPFPGSEQYPEPMVTLAAIAAVTSRIRLSTNILIAPLRPAVLLAKSASTLDCLSGGRLDLGVGTGWHVDEYAAIGVPMTQLASRLDDTLRACRALWSSQPASFSSATVSFSEMYCCPSPVQAEIPIWIGGGVNRGVARRVAELGAGWTPMGGNDLEEVRTARSMITSACQDAGRDPSTVGIRVSVAPSTVGSAQDRITGIVDRMAELAAAGATVVQLPLPQLVSGVDDATEVIASLIEAADARMGPVSASAR